MHGIKPRCRLVLLFCLFLHACTPAAATAPPGDGSSAEAPASAEEVEAVDALAFFVLALLLGIFSTHLLSWTRVPYTAMLLVGTPGLRNSALLLSCERMYRRSCLCAASKCGTRLQVWGLLVGIGNSTGSAHWALLGSGVRMWEVGAMAATGLSALHRCSLHVSRGGILIMYMGRLLVLRVCTV